MDRKLFVNYFYNILYQVVTILAPLIITPYTTRILGDTNLGINAFTGSIVQWFTIFGIMGISNYGIRTIGLVRDDPEQLSRNFCGIFMMQIVNLLLMFCLYCLLIFVAPLSYKTIYFIQGVSLLATMVDISWFYLGIEEFKVASIRNILVKVLGVICIFTFVKSADDLILFVGINVTVAIIGQAIMLIQLRKYVKIVKVPVKEAYQTHFKPNLILFIPQIATSVYSVLDQTLVGLLAKDWEAQSAFYQQAIRFVKMFLYFITSIGSVMLPRIANTFQKGDQEKIMSYLSVTCKLALYLAIPMMFGMMSVAPSFIPWFLAPEFHIVGLLIDVAAPIILLISLSNVFGIQYLLPTGRMKEFSSSVVCGACVNLLANLLLIPRYGALGACIAIVCAEFSVTAIQWFFVRKTLVLTVQKRSIIIYFVSGILMAVVVAFIGKWMGPRILTNIIQILCGAIIYLSLITICKEEFHMEIIHKALSLLKRTS